MRKVYLTGDIHGDIGDLFDRIEGYNLKEQDILILLGDSGLEFHSFYTKPKISPWDDKVQKRLREKIPATIICVQGNHDVPFKEMHGENSKIFGANAKKSNGIYFVQNGEVLTIDEKKFLVIGGAFSIDKDYRLRKGYPYWENEELNKQEMEQIFINIKGKKYNYVLSHTCPLSVMPEKALFDLDFVAENRTEKFLEIVKQNIVFEKWFCGHFHINKTQGPFNFLSDAVNVLEIVQNKEKAL